MKQFSITLVFTALGLWSLAQTTGSSVFRTLNSTTSARVAALGGNQIAVADGDLGLSFYNPALLDSTSNNRLEFSYVNYFSDINFGSAHYAKHLSGIGTASLALQYVDYGDFTETDEFNNDLGNFDVNDVLVNVGFSRQLDSNFTAGANVKFINSTLANYSSSGVALDLGLHYYKKKSQFSAALVFKNMGTQLSNYTEASNEKLPFEIQAGFTKKLRHAPFRFGFMFDNLQQWDIRREDEKDILILDPVTGVIEEEKSFEQGDIFMRHLIFNTEVLISENISLRIGYNYRRRKELAIEQKSGTVGISIGASVKVSKFNISYGRSTYHLAGPSNHFTINTAFGDW
ncbi:MAG: type IX secretion system protein PorQ [Flavobacteriales bacterium]